MRIGLLIPHVFAQKHFLNKIIFTPIFLAASLVEELSKINEVSEIIIFSPGELGTKFLSISKLKSPQKADIKNIFADTHHFDLQIKREGVSVEEMIISNPLAFLSLSREINTQITSIAFEYANTNKLDILHVFMCEDEVPLYFSNLVKIPVVFTHHDPYNFYRKYKARFPNLANLNYVSISLAQRKTAPANLNFVGNVYNGVDINRFKFNSNPASHFIFVGRIIQNKGCHIAIEACLNTNEKLEIAGKHYNEGTENSESYWQKYIHPKIDNTHIFYKGFLNAITETPSFFANAKALLFPSQWDEPFGVVIIEALSCGTPVIAFDCGAIREIIENGKNGFIVKDQHEMEIAMKKINEIDRSYCRESVIKKFTIKKMAQEYLNVYKKLIKTSNK